MDFTGQFQFASGPQAYHSFMPMPLTPSHSHSAPSDEYNNNSPPDAFEGLATNNDAQFHNFDYATQSGFHQSSHHEHQHRNPSFAPGPPTPPNQPTFGQQHAHPQSTQQHAAGTGAAVANGTDGFAGNHALSSDLMSRAKSEPDDMSNDRGGSEEDNMTPAQSKRKAQNRAAQRAFRERKERHVKDLETKLAELEAAQEHSSAENERLKRDLQKMVTENEILKATSISGNGHASSNSPEPLTTGPMHYSPTEFASDLLKGHNNQTFSHRIVQSADGQRLLAVGASWDLIMSHELFQKGLVDIGTISEYLKPKTRCDGQGPVFSENDVLDAIQMSVACGTDDLL